MYEFTYSATCEELPACPLPSFRRKVSDAIELIEAADRARAGSHEKLQLLSDFRRLWLSIAGELARPSREHPPELQAELLPALPSILEEIERCRFNSARNPHAASPKAKGPEQLL